MARKSNRALPLKANPDVDAIVSKGQRYRRALEAYVEAVDTGRGLAAAKREVKAAKNEFENALGVGVPITVISAAVGAGAGAAAFGPIGAMIGAVFAGAAPAIIEAIPDKDRVEDDGPDYTPRAPRTLPNPYKANPNAYKKLMR